MSEPKIHMRRESGRPLLGCAPSICRALALFAVAFAGDAEASIPRLRVNGVGSRSNSSVAHAVIGNLLTLDLRGTPNAKFALMVALESTGVSSGFYLKPSSGPTPLVPIQPVFDGIGSASLATLLGLPSAAFAPSTAHSLFQLDGSGRFQFTAHTPVEAVFFDASNPGTPFVLPLETPPAGPTAAIYLQAVEVHPISGALRVGNGVRVVFDPIVLAAEFSLALSTAPSAVVVPSLELGSTNNLVTVADSDLSSSGSAPPVSAPGFALSPNAIDVFRIELAGVESPIAASHWPSLEVGGPDPEQYVPHEYAMLLASGVDVGTGTRPVRNNDNPQFPMIELPGKRTLFHYRDRSGGSNRFGFGLHDALSGEFLDLTPPAFGAFLASSLNDPSPFEYEVLVRGDGKRAFVVLDAGTAKDRLFLLDLVPGIFSNGFAIIEIALPPEITSVFDASFDWIEAPDGANFALFATTNAANLTAFSTPSHLRAVRFEEGATPITLLPSAAYPSISYVGNAPAVSKGRTTAACIAGTSSASNDLFSVRAVSATNLAVTRCSAFTSGSVAPWRDATSGDDPGISLTPDGSVIAFCKQEGASERPLVVNSDGSSAAAPLLVAKFLSEGGPFDVDDFSQCRLLRLSNDGKALVFALGWALGYPYHYHPERMDVFAADLTTGTVSNLTRTLPGSSLLGPWSAPGDLEKDRATIEIGGTFSSDDGNWLYFFRESRIGSSFINSSEYRFNPVAISLAPTAGGGVPTFEVVNVTGGEFAPFFGAQIEPSAVASVHIGGTGSTDFPVSRTLLRRFASRGPLAGHYVFTARRKPTGAPFEAVVISFDPKDPHSARQLAAFPGTVVTYPSPWVQQLVLDPRTTRVAVAVRSPTFDIAASSAGERQDLYVIDAQSNTPPKLLTDGTYSTEITAGSIRFRSQFPYGLFFAAGAKTSSNMLYDTYSYHDFGPNPYDASLYFHRFQIGSSIPAQTTAVLAPIPAGYDRIVHLWSVR